MKAQFDEHLAGLNDELWEDPEFAPTEEALYEADEVKDEGITFVRASQVESLTGDDLAVFKDLIEPSDINQGELGDCYLLSSLSCLAEHPDRIRKLFVSDQVNPSGCYGLIHCKDGQRQMTMVDDFIPCKTQIDQTYPCYSQAKGKELWVVLIEKMYAKLHSNYARIEGGQPYETIRDLTGAPGRIYLCETTKDLWKIILNADYKDYLMNAGINASENDNYYHD